jgi:hypothetical protein
VVPVKQPTDPIVGLSPNLFKVSHHFVKTLQG